MMILIWTLWENIYRDISNTFNNNGLFQFGGLWRGASSASIEV